MVPTQDIGQEKHAAAVQEQPRIGMQRRTARRIFRACRLTRRLRVRGQRMDATQVAVSAIHHQRQNATPAMSSWEAGNGAGLTWSVK